VRQTSAKTATLTLRVDPQIKELLQTAATADRRSLANMLEVMVLDYCKQRDIGETRTSQGQVVSATPDGHAR
jgi:hypothetical protein